MKKKMMVMKTMVLIVMLMMVALAGMGADSAPVQFIFGDSLSDVGNNNYLTKGIARAALPWYGIDIGMGLPNGRFTNGRTIADIIGDYMGYPRPIAFMDQSLDVDAILKNGVNYASGGGGILNDTGQLFVQRFCFYKQIDLFQGTQKLVKEKIGSEAADKFFKEASYVVALGSNDYINNFLLPVYPDAWAYSSTGFTNLLISTLKDQLTLLHKLGARKLIFFGLGPMGCIPLERVMNTNYTCQDSVNKLAMSFNDNTKQLMQDLSAQLPNATFQFGDAYNEFADLIANPLKHGFSNADSPCCRLGRIRPSLTCTPASSLCKERSKYVFWDEYHPTEAANQVIANAIIKKLSFRPLNAPPSAAAAPSNNTASSPATTSVAPAGAPSSPTALSPASSTTTVPFIATPPAPTPSS
ncbi:GDSL esterase/lipase At1g74460 [Nymphaea colorata]|nr:GDSL esterase/lipase At1g74460 [Nymphaea colorata]